MTDTVSVRILGPEKVVWEGEAASVSSVNSQGPFDILPYHANFITVIENQPIIVRTSDNEESFRFDHAIIYVHSNYVRVYTNI